jgi:hypothetical protein
MHTTNKLVEIEPTDDDPAMKSPTLPIRHDPT